MDICAAADVGTTHPFSPGTSLLFVSNRRLNFTPDVSQILQIQLRFSNLCVAKRIPWIFSPVSTVAVPSAVECYAFNFS